MRYKTLEADSIHELDQAVNAAMADGWKPLGAPFYADVRGSWYQAMTRDAQLECVQLRERVRPHGQ